MKRMAAAIVLLAGIAAAFFAVQGLRDRAASDAPAPGDSPATGPAARSAPPGPQPPSAPAPAADLREPIDPDRRRLAQPDGPDAAGSLPETIDFPIASKYAREELSRVPHRLIGAWDREPDQAALADLRVFVAVVDPQLSDADLERLLRDADARHRDARHLRVQVFDSEAAARRPSWTDGGEAKSAHLVAELMRTPNPQLEVFRVRELRLER